MPNWSAVVIVIGCLAGIVSPFAACSADGQQVNIFSAPPRIVEIKSIINFRDIGGYATRDGRAVKWRKIFRSGDLARSSPKEQSAVSALRFRKVIDLRSDAERARGPSLWHDEKHQPEVVLLPIGGSAADWSSDLSRKLQMGGFGREEIDATFIEMYATVPLENTAEFRALFSQILASDDAALLIHCTAGKDRTGIAIALILSALDVPRETIMEDFMLTNEAVDVALMSRMLAAIFSKGSDQEIDPVAIEPMLLVDPGYLETMFAVIEAEYGSMDNYFRVALGLTAARRAEIREVLLD